MPAPKMSAVSSVEVEVCDCEFEAVPAPCGGELLGEHMRTGRAAGDSGGSTGCRQTLLLCSSRLTSALSYAT